MRKENILGFKLTSYQKYSMMYLSRKLAYNKKDIFDCCESDTIPYGDTSEINLG